MNEKINVAIRRLVPVVGGLAIFGVIMQALGYGGLAVIADIAQGAAGSSDAILQALRWTVPLTLMGLGALVSFRNGYFNVGGLGQFYLGAVGATAVATCWTDGPPWLIVTGSLLAAIAGGAVWSLVPGVLRIFLGADEIVTTIMATFVAQFLLAFLLSGPLKDRDSASAQAAASSAIPGDVRISDSGGISPLVVVIVVIVVGLVWFLTTRTPFGILGGIAGRNEVMLRWQGAGTRRIGVASFAIVGGLGGLAGGIEILGPSGRLVTGLSPQVGNNAMLVALVAGLAVGGAVAASVFFGALTAASLFLPVVAQLPASAIVLLNGLIAILVTARFRFPDSTHAKQREKRLTRAEQSAEVQP